MTHYIGIAATAGRRVEMLTGWIAKYKSGKQVMRYKAELAELILAIAPTDALASINSASSAL